MFCFSLAVVIPVAQKGDTLSTGALVGITVGVSLFVIIILVICCILYRRQKKQIDEYKQLYFLQQSDYKVCGLYTFTVMLYMIIHKEETR